ncbi:MAG TPA: hypothetical protein VJM83_01890 [Nitrospirota bacterium]|nr:hypothetical protein [Nitrospirota bacterium]
MSRRFLCEHQVVPDLDLRLIQTMHGASRPGMNLLFSFSNLGEKCMYSVVESPDRLTVESFFSDLRIPCDSIMEVEVLGEGMGNVTDLRTGRKAA